MFVANFLKNLATFTDLRKTSQRKFCCETFRRSVYQKAKIHAKTLFALVLSRKQHLM